MNHTEKGDTVTVDATVDQASAGDYEGLVLPGGVANPDKLRMNERAVAFVRECFAEGVPIAVDPATVPGRWSRPASSTA